jgi:phosphoribosylglycinamide formyltransferase 1
MDFIGGHMISPVNIALFASGSGTDANAILDAQDAGWIIDGEVKLLVVTKEDAPAIKIGQRHNVEVAVLPHKILKSEFTIEVEKMLCDRGIELIFLVGCIHKIPLIDKIPAYNIHPADIEKFGGKGMYGITVHEKVLEDARSHSEEDRKKGIERWFTYITVHEMDDKYDHGPVFMKCAVEVDPVNDTPAILQKRVLQFEWMLLPTAVNMAIRRIRMKTEE